MVISDWSGGQRPPNIQVQLQETPLLERLARPVDRLGAAIIDISVLLIPVFILLSAPLKRWFTASFILGEEADFVASILAMSLLAAALIVFYQAAAQYFFGTTVGKKIFQIRVVSMFAGVELGFWDYCLRSCLWVFELMCLGLPWLSIFSNQKRRVLHDRLCDTVVVSESRMTASPPATWERTLVRGTYLTIGAFAFLTVFIEARGVLERLKVERSLASLVAQGSNDCEVVSRNTEESEDVHARLKMAMTLYAAGLADRGCLEAEVERETAEQIPIAPVTYLAQAFVHADDAEISNSYLDEVCAIAPRTVECSMSEMVTSWSSDDWASVEQILHDAQRGSGYLEVWGVRHYMKQAEYGRALGLLDDLGMQKAVAEFTMVQRVKALYNEFKSVEADVALSQAVLSLPEEDSRELNSWMCAQELQNGCGALKKSACKNISSNAENAEIDFEEPSQALAQVLTMECKSTKEVDYRSFRDTVRNPDWKAFFAANLKRQKEDRTASAELFARVIASKSTPDLLRVEAIRRWSQFATRDQMKHLLSLWHELPTKEAWVKSGNMILSRLVEQKNSTAALKVARNLMSGQSLSPASVKVLGGIAEPAASERRPASIQVKDQVKELLDSVGEED